MIKNPILILLIFITAFIVNNYSQKITYGLGLGLNATNTHYANSVELNFSSIRFGQLKAGLNLNAFATYKNKRKWGFTIEPGFIQKGFQIKNWNDEFPSDKFRFNYVQIPVTADFYLTEKMSVSIGPEIAYLFHGELNRKYDLTPYYNKFELSALVGLNYSLTKKIKVGLRYNHSLIAVQKWNYYDVNQYLLTTRNTFLQYFQVNVKYVLT